MLSSWDDYPVHQVAEPIRHAGTSDRNFYDRYYFNLHGSTDELFLILGLGQYPNLAVSDAFTLVRRGTEHRVRARLARARRPGRHLGRAAAGGGDRATPVGAGGARAQRVGGLLRPALGRGQPRLRGAPPLHPQARPGAVRHHALRPDRHLDRPDPPRRRRHRGHARPVEGHPRPVVGCAARGRGRGPGHPCATTRRCRACGTTRPCSSTTTPSSTWCRSPTRRRERRSNGS